MRIVNSRARSFCTALGVLACALPATAQQRNDAAQGANSGSGDSRIAPLRIEAGEKSRAGEKAPAPVTVGPQAVWGAAETDQSTSVEEVAEQPARYDGRVVRVRGRGHVENAAGARERDVTAVSSAPVLQTSIAVTPASIASDPGSYFGHDVIVNGHIEEVLTSTLFTLDEDTALAGPDVVVLNPRPALILEGGAEVAVAGRLERFDWAALRRQFPWLELEPQLVRALQGRPLIVATGVARMLSAPPVRSDDAGGRPRRR